MSEHLIKGTGLWLVFAGLAIFGYSAYYILIKLGGVGSIPPAFGVVQAGTAALCHCGLFFLTRKTIGHGRPSLKMLGLGILGGVLMLFNLYSSFFMFKSGGALSITMPVLGVSTIFLSVLFGVVALKETLNTKQKMGLVLALVSIALLNL